MKCSPLASDRKIFGVLGTVVYFLSICFQIIDAAPPRPESRQTLRRFWLSRGF